MDTSDGSFWHLLRPTLSTVLFFLLFPLFDKYDII